MIVSRGLPWSKFLHLISEEIAVFLLFDITVAVGYTLFGQTWLAVPEIPLSLAGTALTIFLGFKTNSAYDRWWEARTLWGSLINASRTLARRAIILPSAATGYEEAEQIGQFKHKLVYFQIAYVHALRSHLRNQDPLVELPQWLAKEDIDRLSNQQNVPAAILLEMGKLAQNAYQQGWIDSYRFIAIEDTLNDLTNVQGGCERIKNTPLPRQYDYFPRLFVHVYCILLPIGLVQSLHLFTPVISTLIAFMFIALDSIGRRIATPFENTIHDTPMTALARSIEINLKQSLGEEKVPPALQPVEGFLF